VTDATEELRALADRILSVYEERTRPLAVLLAGSAGRGDADFYSDLDLLLYYDELPPRATIDEARDDLGGALIRVAFENEATDFGETFELAGVQCQLGHLTVAACEEELDRIAVGEKLGTPLAKVVMGLLEGLPLSGEELIDAWRERVRYRDELQRAVIERHWQFFPLWYFEDVIERRDARLWRHQVIVEAVFNLLSVLAALNRAYFTEFELKRTRDFVAKLSLAPPDLADRLEHLFTPDPDAKDLDALIGETQALLAEHRPEIELPPLRKSLGARASPWAS